MFHGLSHHLTLMLILSLLSTMEFFTRMFSSFKSLCTISVRRSTLYCWKPEKYIYLKKNVLIKVGVQSYVLRRMAEKYHDENDVV